MAQVIITISDKEGGVKVKQDFNPTWQPTEKPTMAQAAALAFLAAMKDCISTEDYKLDINGGENEHTEEVLQPQ